MPLNDNDNAVSIAPEEWLAFLQTLPQRLTFELPGDGFARAMAWIDIATHASQEANRLLREYYASTAQGGGE